MSQFSDDLHNFLNHTKAKFERLADEIESKGADVAKVTIAEIEQIVGDAGPVLAAAAVAGVGALIAAGPVGGVTAALAAAEAAALQVLIQQGKPLLQRDLIALKVVVLNELVKQQQTSTPTTVPASS